MLFRLLALTAVGIIAANVRAQAPVEAALAGDRFRLASVGDRPIEERRRVALAQCHGHTIIAAWLELQPEGRWTSADTMTVGCAADRTPLPFHVTAASGFVRISRDTIAFHVYDPSVGDGGFVFLGVRSGDRLQILLDDEEGGDHMFQRVRDR